jgi:hypothetical protein
MSAPSDPGAVPPAGGPSLRESGGPGIASGVDRGGIPPLSGTPRARAGTRRGGARTPSAPDSPRTGRDGAGNVRTFV